MANPNQLIFITGAPRTGTTMLLKLCGTASGYPAFAQPLPLLLSDLKRAFLKPLDVPDWHINYPLADQVFETAYDVSDFSRFLDNTQLDHNLLKHSLSEMVNYSGQYFKLENPLLPLVSWQSGTFIDFACHYLFNCTNQASASSIFWKESFAEEYIPMMLQNGSKVILIIRDPRDSLVSQLKGDFEASSGVRRPLLYSLRQWRKSVSYILNYKDHPSFQWLRYEDLVSDPGKSLAAVFANLGLPEPDDINLQGWQGNSSFDKFKTISTASTKRHQGKLNPDTQAFMEAICYHEMKALNYEPKINRHEIVGALRSGPAEDYLSRDSLSHYEYTAERRDEELMRTNGLMNRNSNFNAEAFIHEHTFHTLKNIEIS